MKIGFDAKRLFNNFTGLGNYSRFVVKALSEYYPDHQYTLYSPKVRTNPDTEYFLRQNNIQLRQPHGVHRKLSGIWRSYRLGNVAAQDKIQLLHGLSNELPVTKPRGLRTVVTIHDVIYKRYPEFYKPIDRFIYDLKFRKACASADKIIAVSKQTAEDAVEFLHADPAKVQVVYQGCHPIFQLQYSPEQMQSVRKKYSLPDQFILNVGTIESRKNALLILKALQQIKQKLYLVIVGRSTPYQKELNEFIRTNQMQNQVRFIHDASFPDLPLIYRAASLFIYPSLFEGFGIPIVEAIASGIPVISSTGSCFAEAGGPDCLYVDPGNAEHMASAIEETYRDSSITQSRIHKSAEYIKRFEPKVIADHLMSVYKEMV